MNNLKLLRCPNCRQQCTTTKSCSTDSTTTKSSSTDNENESNQKLIKIGIKCKNEMNKDWECCICMNYENEINNSIIKLNGCMCKGNNQYVHEECIMSFFKILTKNIGDINFDFDFDDEDELYEHLFNEFINFKKSFKKSLDNHKKKKYM